VSLIRLARRLSAAVDRLEFAEPVTHVYNPLKYARRPHEVYLERYGSGHGRIVLVGMNPGPHGMAQTGVPFGDPVLVREWLGIEAPVDRPSEEHPKRPVIGFRSARREVSGQRVWGWAKQRFGEPGAFFERFFIANYCPLCFLEASGRNRTPDKLRRNERAALEEVCDDALAELIRVLRPRAVLGVGKFAEGRVRAAVGGGQTVVGGVLHPSPASPRANRGWAGQVEADLAALGLWG
jgi:single-strand selective monofunctional uracil DNA glycosylase